MNHTHTKINTNYISYFMAIYNKFNRKKIILQLYTIIVEVNK